MSERRAIRGRILSFTDDPAEVGAAASHRYLDDGLVVIEGGVIAAVDHAAALLPSLPPGTLVDP
jgi:guanine deaminase